MGKYKQMEELEKIATKLTGSAPILDSEYVSLYYTRESGKKWKTVKGRAFKDSRRII